MATPKSITLSFYCINEKLCKSKFCICGSDICPYLRAEKRRNPLLPPKLKHGIKSAVAVEEAIDKLSMEEKTNGSN